ncbi:short-chain dehydrogenase of unknown substrate specificity [Spongiibacter sp. IMCC21906]|uniref:SDR family oxidoreductase n=1 Tax=Spongiibacter sp. IMCC21906 TaxID=1620392 RepID=UPI00062DD84F|nr:SDR family oxidoreductase [Spongiibacter sp. IMCC21906]AKH68364.1 short-chain dehydrogenase of unknown substrate specificity [Spongiibacter sp. IMCC21906]
MTKRVFITGGASGLGLALAHCFAEVGYLVCIADINDGRGEIAEADLAKKTTTQYLHCDVQKEADLQAAANWLEVNWDGVDVVINNAGIASAGNIDAFSLEDWQGVVNVNLLGVVRGCKVFTPLLKRLGGGHIVNVASLAGLIHPPKMASYCATKAAVVALSESMSVELDRDNINVSVVCPSFFRTNLFESVKASDADSKALAEKLVSKAKVGADEIASRVFAGIRKGDFYILPHAEARRLWRLKRCLPYRLYRGLMLKASSSMMKGRLPA